MNLFKRILPDIVVIILLLSSHSPIFPGSDRRAYPSQHDSVAGIGAGEEAKEYLERTGERTRWTNSILVVCLLIRWHPVMILRIP